MLGKDGGLHTERKLTVFEASATMTSSQVKGARRNTVCEWRLCTGQSELCANELCRCTFCAPATGTNRRFIWRNTASSLCAARALDSRTHKLEAAAAQQTVEKQSKRPLAKTDERRACDIENGKVLCVSAAAAAALLL